MTHRLVLTLSDDHYALIKAVSKSAGSPSISAWACMQLVANANKTIRDEEIEPISSGEEPVITPLPSPTEGSGWGAKPTKP